MRYIIYYGVMDYYYHIFFYFKVILNILSVTSIAYIRNDDKVVSVVHL